MSVQVDVEWDEAMSWWTSQGEMVERGIRNVAIKRLEDFGVEEIGTSDVNCSVFEVWKTYKLSGEPGIWDFLFDQMAG